METNIKELFATTKVFTRSMEEFSQAVDLGNHITDNFLVAERPVPYIRGRKTDRTLRTWVYRDFTIEQTLNTHTETRFKLIYNPTGEVIIEDHWPLIEERVWWFYNKR